MPLSSMKLKILLPSRVFLETTGVSRIVAESADGAIGLLPRRLDCTFALVPSLLTYETEAEGEQTVAIDEGVFVKAGEEVLVSARRALGGELARLKDCVAEEFEAPDKGEQALRSVMAKLEAGFLQRMVGFYHE